MHRRIAPIFHLKSAMIYILSCLEHEKTNIWKISCSEEMGGVFGESAFSVRNLKCNEAFYGRKMYIAQLFKTCAICDIIGNK